MAEKLPAPQEPAPRGTAPGASTSRRTGRRGSSPRRRQDAFCMRFRFRPLRPADEERGGGPSRHGMGRILTPTVIDQKCACRQGLRLCWSHALSPKISPSNLDSTPTRGAVGNRVAGPVSSSTGGCSLRAPCPRLPAPSADPARSSDEGGTPTFTLPPPPTLDGDRDA